MKFSIITVCYNAQETIEDTLRSIQRQSYENIEHIVIDGASTDSTLDIIRNYENGIDCLVSEPDHGIYDAMNKGIGLASGEVVAFLNADDLYVDQFVIERIAGLFAKTPVDACYTDLIYVDPNDLDKIVRYWQSSDYKKGLFAKGWCPPHPTFFVKKKIYERYGAFDLGYSIGNDVELMMRFLAKDLISSQYLPEVTVKMRVGGVSNRSITDIVRQNLEILRAARANGIAISPVTFLWHKLFSRCVQYRVRPELSGCKND